MSLNHELICTRCQEIEESLSRLEQIKGKSRKEFLQDQDLQDIACYRCPFITRSIIADASYMAVLVCGASGFIAGHPPAGSGQAW